MSDTRHGDAVRAAGFDGARRSLTVYFHALARRTCELVPYDDDGDLWQHPDTATTVRLPSHAPVSRDGAFDAAGWYQVAMTHRALHHALGTFDLDLDRPEPLFARLRPAARSGAPAVPPLERFAGLFGRAALAVEVFAVLEDLRVDAAARRLFAGSRARTTAYVRPRSWTAPASRHCHRDRPWPRRSSGSASGPRR